MKINGIRQMQCIIGLPRKQNNKRDQAPTAQSQRTAFQASFGSAGVGEREVAGRGGAASTPGETRGLYFPVNLRDETARPAVEGHAGEHFRNGDRLYFPVNSRNETVGVAIMPALADR
jgi:hypothetical protein